MKNLLSLLSTSALSLATFLAFPAGSYAGSQLPVDPVREFGFTDANRLDGDELSGLRGGLRVGALNFDFAITTKTIVDGMLQHNSFLTSALVESSIGAKYGAPKVENLVVDSSNQSGNAGVPDSNQQSGDSSQEGGNQSVNLPVAALAGVDVKIDNGNLTTTIQNSNDNAVIQQFNQMDLVVSNLSELQKQNIIPYVDFQAVQAAH